MRTITYCKRSLSYWQKNNIFYEVIERQGENNMIANNLQKTSHNRLSTETTPWKRLAFLNSVSQYYVRFRNKGLTRDPEKGTKSRVKKSANKSRKWNPQSNPGKEIRNQIQEKKSAIKSWKINPHSNPVQKNPQSNPGKEIRNKIQEKKSAIKSRRRNPQSNPGKEIRN